MGNAYGNKTKNIQGLVIHDGEKISNGANISGLHFPFRRSQWPFIPRHTPSLFFLACVFDKPFARLGAISMGKSLELVHRDIFVRALALSCSLRSPAQSGFVP